jgi:hypothetical protein
MSTPAVGETFMRSLYCPLTASEIQARGSELATKMEEREQIESAFESVKKEFKGKLESAGNAVNELKQIVLERREKREIECYLRPDYEQGVMITIRTDTHSEVDRRRMTNEEMQGMLPLVNDALRKLSDDEK